MVSVLMSSVVDRGFEPLLGQTKDNEIKKKKVKDSLGDCYHFNKELYYSKLNIM